MFTDILLLAALAFYIFCFCVPSFMIVKEGRYGTCGFFEFLTQSFFLLLGFPGALLAILLKFIVCCRNQNKIKQRKQKQTKAKTQTTSNTQKSQLSYAEQTIRKFMNGTNMPHILEFIKKDGLPYKIACYGDHIETSGSNSRDVFTFLSNGMNDIPTGSFHTNEPYPDLYYFAFALNRALGKPFSVRKVFDTEPLRDRDGYIYDYLHTLKYVVLERELKDW